MTSLVAVWTAVSAGAATDGAEHSSSLKLSGGEDGSVSSAYIYNKVALIDCLTLWATNFFFSGSSENSIPDVDKCLEEIKAEFDKFTNQDATFIFVTNEIGSGGVSGNAIQRRFTDLLGWLNQYVAKKADEVYLTVSGIPVKIK